MTIIGPRPKTIFETVLMKDTKFIYRNAIKPGLSSWSVIHGRNNMRNDKALSYDFEHVVKFSVWLDIKIFFRTIGLVLRRTGVETDGHATFLHLGDFLVQNGLKTPDQIEEARKEALKIEADNLKNVPLGITKDQFKEKRRQMRHEQKNYCPSVEPIWD